MVVDRYLEDISLSSICRATALDFDAEDTGTGP